MSKTRLFTAIYIPETPFVNEVLKPKKSKKYNYELVESKKSLILFIILFIKRMKNNFIATIL